MFVITVGPPGTRSTVTYSWDANYVAAAARISYYSSKMMTPFPDFTNPTLFSIFASLPLAIDHMPPNSPHFLFLYALPSIFTTNILHRLYYLIATIS
jgi:hypothetical protein